MTRSQTDLGQQISSAQQWCIEARKLLKLGLLERGSVVDLTSLAKKIGKNLESLKGLVPAKVSAEDYQKLAQDFIEIATRIKQSGSQQDKAGYSIDAERLDVLNHKIELAKAKATGDKQGESKASKELVGLREQYDVAIKKAEETLKLKLAPLPLVNTQPLSARIETAKKAALKQDYVGALHALKGWESVYEQCKKEAEELKKEADRQLAAKDHYESKKQKLTEARQQLSLAPGAEKQLQEIKKALDAGTLAAQGGQPNEPESLFQDGYDAIVKVVPKVSKLLSAGLESIQTAQKKLDNLPGVGPARTEAETALKSLVDQRLLSESQEQIERQKIVLALKECGTNSQAGIQKLQTLTRELKQKETLLAKQRETCSQLASDIELQLQHGLRNVQLLLEDEQSGETVLAPLVPKLQGLLRELRTAQALISVGELGPAQVDLERLREQATQLIAGSEVAPDKLKTQWNDRAQKKSDVEQKIQELVQLIKAQGRTTEDVKKWETALPADLEECFRLASEGSYGPAMKKFDGLVGFLRSMTDQLEGRQALTPIRTAANDKVQQVVRKIESSLTTLQQAVANRPDGNTILQYVRGQLSQVVGTWENQLDIAQSEGELDPQDTLARLNELLQLMQKAASGGESLANFAELSKNHAASQQFDQLVKEAQLQLNELADYDSAAQLQLAKEFKNLQSAAPDPTGGYAVSVTGLQKFVTDQLTVALTTAKENRQSLLQAVQDKHQLTKEKVKEVITTAKKSLKPKDQKFFQSYFDSLVQSLKDLNGMCTSTSVKTLQLSLVACEDLMKQCARLMKDMATPVESYDVKAQQLLGMLDNQDEFGLVALFEDEQYSDLVKDADFRLVKTSFELLAKQLADSNLKVCKPTLKAYLDEEFKVLQRHAGEQEPAVTLVSLKDFGKRVISALSQAEAAAELRRVYREEKLPAVQREFKELAKYTPETLFGKLQKRFQDVTAYAKELEGRISQAGAKINTEGEEKKALELLEQVRLELVAAVSSIDVFAEREGEAQQRKAAAETQKKQFTAMVENFKRNELVRAEKAVKEAQGDASQIKDLNRMLAQAEDIFKDTGNYVGAVELVNNARKYAARVVKNPQGLKATARGELPKVQTHWKSAVKQFNDSLEQVSAALENSGKDLTPSGPEDRKTQETQEAITQAAALLRGLKTAFDTTIFDAAITTLVNDRAGIREKRAARETALRRVHEYADRLRKDPLLLKLLQPPQPFGTVNLYALNTALRDLDLNIQRCV